MKTTPDIKFISKSVLGVCYKKFQESKEPIIISADCFWGTSNRILNGLNYEIYTLNKDKIDDSIFSPTFQYVYKELITAWQCNNERYTDEIIFVGAPWELDKANKYFGDGMMINGFEI